MAGTGAALAPRKSQSQAVGLLLIALLVGHEAQLVASAINANGEPFSPLNSSGHPFAGLNAKGGAASGFAEPSETVSSLALHGSAAARSLALSADWNWNPTGTFLRLTTRLPSGELVYEEKIDKVFACANLDYEGLRIKEEGAQFGTEYLNSVVKLVSEEADRTHCSTTTYDVAVGAVQNRDAATQSKITAMMGLSRGRMPLEVSNGNELVANNVEINFMHGGIYKLCYTPDGTFGGSDDSEWKENTVLTLIHVYGIKSPCKFGYQDNCIEQERWECSFGLRGEGVSNCEFNFNYDGAPDGWEIWPGEKTKMTWSAAFGDDVVTSSGVLTSSTRRECTTMPATGQFDVAQTGMYLQLDLVSTATLPPVLSDQTEAFTVAACYCPNYDREHKGTYCTASEMDWCCDDEQDYIQMFGTIYYWTIRICDAGPNAVDYTQCSSPYMRVIPQQKFVLRVDCPPAGGCEGNERNRVMFLDPRPDNDRPNWDSLSGCKTSSIESVAAVWPAPSDSRTVDGGGRVDYKVWRSKQVKINLSLNKKLDICFANSAPEASSSWFRIGQVITSTSFAFASKTSASSEYKHLKYIGHPGSITLLGGIRTSNEVLNPYDGNKYSGKALLNIISFDREQQFGVGADQMTMEEYLEFDQARPLDFQDIMDVQCQKERYYPPLVEGLWSKQAARNYIGNVDYAGGSDTVSRFQTFSGNEKNRLLTITEAGTVAICYCAMVSFEEVCEDPSYWIYVGQTTIRGPFGGQTWKFDTDIVVHIAVTGWGFSGCDASLANDCLRPNRDKLRIIKEGGCTENGNSPEGDSIFKVGCPARAGAGCRSARPTEDIVMNAVTGRSSNTFITSVDVQLTKTTLTFSRSVEGVLKKGDHITIDPTRVLMSGNLTVDPDTPEKLFELYKFSGEYEFYDDREETYWVSHKLDDVVIAGVPETDKLSIPIGWTEDPVFRFKDDQGHWTMRNQISSSVELKGKQPAVRKVCWGVYESGITRFYAQAGEVTFVDPPTRPVSDPKTATVSLTTTMNNIGPVSDRIPAPVVISFETADLVAYRQQSGMTQLMLRFLDVSDDQGQLVPTFTGDFDPNGLRPQQIEDNSQIVPEEMRQWVCGHLFVEMWSEEDDGFPLPAGCHYGMKYRDEPETENPNPTFYREFFIVFGPGSGLRQGKKYQLVMNAIARNVVPEFQLLDMYAMCAEETACERPYMVFEKIRVKAAGTAPAGASYVTIPPSVAGDGAPKFGVNGFELQKGDQFEVLDLSEENVLQIKLTGAAGSESIKRESIIRIFLWPITLWDIGRGDCSAECRPFHAANAICQGRIECKPLQVVENGNRNIIKIRLPTEMQEITTTVQHTIKITGLTLPMYGFFPSRVGAELRDDLDEKPSYTTSRGYLMKQPEHGLTTGRLVLDGRTGYGPRPFAGQTLNHLYVRIQFGATMWHNGEEQASLFAIDLPKQYSCTVPDDGQPPVNLPVFKVDDNRDGYPDHMRGILSTHTTDGDWDISQLYRCVYSLRFRNAVYAKQVAYIKVTVNNPVVQTYKGDTMNNVWTVKLMGMGYNHHLPYAYDLNEEEFITLAQEKQLNGDRFPRYWGANAAVLSKLDADSAQNFKPVIQPADFRRSCCGATYTPRKDFVKIFFYSGSNVGRNGYVIIDAPPGFNFGETCSAMDLDESYYAFVGLDPLPRLSKLRHRGACVGLKYPVVDSVDPSNPGPPLNRARILVGGAILDNRWYGLALQVEHPAVYSTSQHEGWYIWTEESNGWGMEGTEFTVRLNRYQAPGDFEFWHESFGMYDNHFDDMGIQILNVKPLSVTSLSTDVIFYPIVISDTVGITDTSLRITAPDGYVWDAITERTYAPQTNGTTVTFTPFPVAENNQLIWTSLGLEGQQVYGFRAKIQVPNFSPVTSTNAFFVEWGFDKATIEGRLAASVIQAPPVMAITNAKVAYASNLKGYENNMLELHAQTMTTLYDNQGLIVEGSPATAGFQFAGSYMVLDESDPVPSDTRIIVGTSPTGLPRLLMKAVNTPIPPGLYKIEVPVINPDQTTDPAADPGVWSFGTFNDPAVCPLCDVIDKALEAPSFRINGEMGDFQLVPLLPRIKEQINRNDRPGKPNQLIFRFKLSTQVATKEQIMTLRGPRGFEFDEDCISQVVTSAEDLFGPNSRADFSPALSLWPEDRRTYPTACVGDGRQAQLSVPEGLQKNNYYAFRIGVRQNPLVTPTYNKWSLDFNQETSQPFVGDNIWTNAGMSVTPVTKAKTSLRTGDFKTVNPVLLTFQPYNTIPFKPPQGDDGGLIRLQAPAGFEFEEINDECQVMLEEEGGGVVFLEGDLKCTVQNRRGMLLEVVGNKPIRGGQMYVMIVFVYNPPTTMNAAEWSMDSFSTDHQDALDESTVKGYSIDNVLYVFSVTNPNDIRNGRTVVDEVDIMMQFPDPIRDDDMIEVKAPIGFDIQGNPDVLECRDFAWRNNNRAFSEPPKCECTGSDETVQCTLYWEVKEYKDPALRMAEDVHFTVSTENPASTPGIMENYWRATHLRDGNVVKSAHVCKSWDINPQLEEVDIVLLEGPQAAGALGDLEFQFKPVSDANTIKIEAVFPTEFSFDFSSTTDSYTIDRRSERNMILINNVPIRAGKKNKPECPTEVCIRINSVRLGRGGGTTTFNIVTYSTDLPDDMSLSDKVKMDEKLSFTGGFRLPGKIAILAQDLTSTYTEQAQLFPVKSLFLPRVDEDAKAVFTVSFTQKVYASVEKLMVSCQGPGAYSLKAAPFVVVGTGQVETSTELIEDEIQATLKPGRPASEVALQADTPYKIIMWVIPRLGKNTWWFHTSDQTKYPTNTNDGEAMEFTPVKTMTATVEVTRAPPGARTDVRLNVDQGDAVIRELLVIAPPAFVFPLSGCGGMCQAGEALGSTGRRTALIKSPTGEPLTSLTGLTIRVVTPEYTPDSILWFVEGRGQGAGTTEGWGEASGFLVEQMSPLSVWYPGVANLKAAQISFMFTVAVSAGTQIAVMPPTGYLLTCSAQGALRQISLPGRVPDCVDDPMELILTETLTKGQYAFVVNVDVPVETPDPNTFNIIIKNQNGQVVDAAFQVPGQPIVQIPAHSPTLTWTSSEPGQTTTITYGFTFAGAVSELKCVLLNFPEKFIHDVQRPTDVQNLNKQFRVAAGANWADTTYTDRIRIRLDDSDPSITIPPGVYEFSFPALVPNVADAEMPRENVWYLSLCGDCSCKLPGDAGITATFPMAGFSLNERSPEFVKAPTNAAPPSPTLRHTSVVFLALFAPVLVAAL